MQQLKLIISREYWTRVRRTSFLIATLITPLAFGVFVVVVNYILQYKSAETVRIAVIDEGGIFSGGIADEDNIYFKLLDTNLDTLKNNFADFDYDGILVTPALGDLNQVRYNAKYYTNQKLTLDLEPILADRLRTALRKHKIAQLNLDERSLKALDSQIDIEPAPISAASTVGTPLAGRIAAVIGMVMAFFMYTTVFIYGMMVMRSVMEEKTSRIVEVMISSVRPFPLMLGKIIGVGLVGLTQVLAWAILVAHWGQPAVRLPDGQQPARRTPGTGGRGYRTPGCPDHGRIGFLQLVADPAPLSAVLPGGVLYVRCPFCRRGFCHGR
jgi:ABC-2 type transport system permease protein